MLIFISLDLLISFLAGTTCHLQSFIAIEKWFKFSNKNHDNGKLPYGTSTSNIKFTLCYIKIKQLFINFIRSAFLGLLLSGTLKVEYLKT